MSVLQHENSEVKEKDIWWLCYQSPKWSILCLFRSCCTGTQYVLYAEAHQLHPAPPVLLDTWLMYIQHYCQSVWTCKTSEVNRRTLGTSLGRYLRGLPVRDNQQWMGQVGRLRDGNGHLGTGQPPGWSLRPLTAWECGQETCGRAASGKGEIRDYLLVGGMLFRVTQRFESVGYKDNIKNYLLFGIERNVTGRSASWWARQTELSTLPMDK